MSYISAQIKDLREIAEMYDGMDGGELLKEAADTIESLYKKQSNNGWIPCSDRLPTMEECQKNDCRFIVSDGNRIYQSTFDYNKKYFVRYTNYSIDEDKCVIAWQTLPEPYITKE